MTRKTPDWLRDRREFCEEQFSFLAGEFGYRRSLRRFRWGGFQLGYLGPGAGVLVERYPRDGVMDRTDPGSHLRGHSHIPAGGRARVSS